MSYNYSKLSANVKKLLAKFGQAMTLSRDTPGAYDPATQTVTNTTTTAADNGVILPYTTGQIDGSLIQKDDQQVFINISTAPLPGDRLTVGGKGYNIIAVKAIEPAGVNVLYELQVRA